MYIFRPASPVPMRPAPEMIHCRALAASILPRATRATVPVNTVMNMLA